MKKFFFLAIAASLLAAGCQKTEVLNQVNPVDGTSMTFAPNMGKLTKAAESTGMANLEQQDFRLWAYYVAADPNRGAGANSIYDSMENIAVTNGTEGWGTSPVHFWPGKGKELRFFAVSADSDTYGAEKSKSTDAENATRVSITTGESSTLTVTNFVVSNTAPDVDLMVADFTTGQQRNGDKGNNNVDLKFRHALAKVQFLFKNEMAKDNDPNPVIVQHMYVSNIINKGTLTVIDKTSESLPFTWEPSSVTTDKARFGGDFTSNTSLPVHIVPAENLEQYTGKKGAADYKQVPTGNEMLLTVGAQIYDTWLVIPQTVATSADDKTGLQVVIAYLIGNRQFVATFPLYSQNASAWNPNQYIKYNISLSPNMIGFNPTVEDWTPVVNDPEKDPATGPNDPSNDGQNIPIN